MEMFKKVLVATDRVKAADSAVLTAAKIADQSSTKLHIIHVLESASIKNRDIVKHYQSGEEMLTTAAYEKSVKTVIMQNYARQLKENQNCEVKVVSGFPWHEIGRFSREVGPDLIVMGPHSSKAQEKGVVRVAGKLGSTVEGVIMHERCPVMIINHEIPADRLRFQKILVAIDFSESCACALWFAVSLARAFQSTLYLFHMLPVTPDPEYSQADYTSDLDAARQRLHAFCRDAVAGADHEFSLWGGALPHVEILNSAEKHHADLIVMGSHTKEKQGKWYTGNAVERVAFRSKCPVAGITDPAALRLFKESVTVGNIHAGTYLKI
jgi:nucleotide-binding universal stress UspA family protein